MRDSACQASVVLSSYVSIVGGHSALTSECGSMLEEVSSIYMSLVGLNMLKLKMIVSSGLKFIRKSKDLSQKIMED